jgi:hypothetical protein
MTRVKATLTRLKLLPRRRHGESGLSRLRCTGASQDRLRYDILGSLTIKAGRAKQASSEHVGGVRISGAVEEKRWDQTFRHFGGVEFCTCC